MKIVFYISSLNKGGAERVISNLANYFSNDKKNEVYLILESPIVKYTISNNVHVITLEKSNKEYNLVTKKIRYIGYIYKLKKIFRKIKPDIIIPFLALPAFMALISRNKSSKVIIGVRNDPKTEYTTFLKKKMMHKLYPKANGFVFQTKEAQAYFKQIINCKQTIIYNAVSDDFVNYTNDFKRRKKDIVAVGRLHKQKNYPILIEAFTDIAKRYPNYKLVIYGEGPEKENIKKIISNNKITDKVILAGNVDNIKDKISDASLYVMTSDFEGMPNALIEAMVLGLPVISTDCPCGGPKELINSGKNGILVGVNKKQELIGAMERLLCDENFANKLGDEARKIIKKVDPNIIYTQWDDFINLVISGGIV